MRTIATCATGLLCAFCLVQPGAHAESAAVPSAGPVRWRTGAGDGPSAAASAFVEVTDVAEESLRELESASMTAARWQRVLSVFADQGDPVAELTVPPMAGGYRVSRGTIRFEPAFPLQPGLRYRAVFRPEALRAPSSTARPDRTFSGTYLIPLQRASPTTVVAGIHPSAESLPENLLKFYLHFSAPMSRGHIYEHIHLRESDSGQDVELPFLEIDEELWDPAMRRLTLLLDPGRIKRGVKPLEEIGSALTTGKQYSLVIDAGWLDATGTPLKSPFAKTFRMLPADREPPDPARWTWSKPWAGATDPLEIDFDEPLDHAIVLRVFRILGPDGAPVQGSATLGHAERQWRFTPREPWRAGVHQLLVPTSIEDLAGNNIGKPFDVDLFESVDHRLTNAIVRLPFTLR